MHILPSGNWWPQMDRRSKGQGHECTHTQLTHSRNQIPLYILHVCACTLTCMWFVIHGLPLFLLLFKLHIFLMASSFHFSITIEATIGYFRHPFRWFLCCGIMGTIIAVEWSKENVVCRFLIFHQFIEKCVFNSLCAPYSLAFYIPVADCKNAR